MTSSDINNLKKINNKHKKRILFLNPKKKDTGYSLPHNGLAMLASILKKRGHDVFVVDYMFLRFENKHISYFIDLYKPDIIGVSMYSPNFYEANELITTLRKIDNDIPVMVGGPFPTLYMDILDKDNRIDYIFIGEAELTIIGAVESAKREQIPKIIQAKEIIDLNLMPYPDYTAFYNYKSIIGYPIMTSRGCPNQCSFCASKDLAYRRWRMRSPEDCIKEISLAKKTISPNIAVYIYDDNPTVHKKRFNDFLELFHRDIGGKIIIVNTRADAIDNTFLNLLKKCGITSIMIGVEHAYPEVFKLVDKGETLEQIEQASKLIKKHGLGLGLSFVVGLPLDNLERTKYSIDFYNRMKADGGTVNAIIPFRGTTARKWFEEHGAKLYNEIGKSTGLSKNLECTEPLVETPDFTKEERKRAYYMFLLNIGHDSLKLKKFHKIIMIAIKYNLYSDFIRWLPKGITTAYALHKMRFFIGLNILKTQGLNELIKRYKFRNKD